MLYLFDIDGTLVDIGGAGIVAIQETNCEIFGDAGPSLDLAGATDLGIVFGLHDYFSVEATGERVVEYLSFYHQRLEWNLQHGGFPGRVLDGVSDCLNALAMRSYASVGLLTGNCAAGAATKVRHYGLDSYFSFGAYGCDHHDRNQLGQIALDRAAAHAGCVFYPESTWVIGDTPKDIACAKAMGARCLAVATGRFTTEELRANGADLVVESLHQAHELI